MESDTVTVAVSIAGGFGAAIVGALCGGRITLRAAREAARRDDERRRLDEIVEVRAAARLIRHQLGAVAASIDAVLRDNYWIRETALDERVWAAHSGALARLLDDEEEWYAVTSAVAAARHHDSLTETFGGPTHTKSEVKAVLQEQRDALTHGIEVLDHYITLGALTPRPAAPR